MRIWLVSIFEQTPIDNVFSTRFLSIAEEALNRGHEIVFYGSTFKHNTKNQRFNETTLIELQDKYKMLFVKSLSYNSNVSIKRLYSHLKLGKAIGKEFDNQQKPDVILLAFPPISLAYYVTKWAQCKSVPVVMDIIDPWPDLFEREVPQSLNVLGKVMFKLPKKRVTKTLSKVTKLTAISHQYLNWSEKYFSVQEKECLYPASNFEAVQNFITKAKPVNENGEKFCVIYAGSLASSYDIPTILESAKLLSDNKLIHFYIAGAGPQEKLIIDYIKEYENLTFLGRLPKDQLMRYYAHCDVGLTQHIAGATQSVTYKLFDLLSAGLPILNSLESEMKSIIVNNEVGLHNVPYDAEQLMKNISTLFNDKVMYKRFKKNSLKFAKEVGDTKVIYKRFVTILEEVGNETKNN